MRVWTWAAVVACLSLTACSDLSTVKTSLSIAADGVPVVQALLQGIVPEDATATNAILVRVSKATSQAQSILAQIPADASKKQVLVSVIDPIITELSADIADDTIPIKDAKARAIVTASLVTVKAALVIAENHLT